MSVAAKPRMPVFAGLGFSAGLPGSALRLPTAERPLALPLRAVAPEPLDGAAGPRAKIWELHATFHCSIIGTCLTSGELKSLLGKLGLIPPGAVSDHELHKAGVTLAGMRGAGAKLLNKTLDRKFRRQIAASASARTDDVMRAFWDAALDAGDIPGGYWAVMTHPATSEVLVRHVFGEIHMLSHLVGAANRADIRRLRELESDNAALRATNERQQAALRAAVLERDTRIRALQDALAGSVARDGDAPARDDDALASVIAELRERLARSGRRAAHLEGRAQTLDQRALAAGARATAAEAEAAALREESQALEMRLGALLAPDGSAIAHPDAGAAIDLAGATILYVGGRASQLPHLRALVAQLNGVLIHHDGGADESAAALPGAISRADAVLFPVDCVSHAAMFALKRQCKQAGKPYLPLRSASLAALLRGLGALQVRRQTAEA